MIHNDETAPQPALPPLEGSATGRAGRLERWLLVLLVLLAFARGVWALGEKSLWWDESLSLYRAQQTLASVLSNEIILTDTLNEIVTIDNHPPLYFLLLWLSVRAFGVSEFALRFLSLASVVLAVPLLYVTGKRLVDRWAGLGAATLGALSPMYLWYGQEARMYAILAFFSLLSFYCFVRAFFDSSRLSNPRTHWRWIAAYLVASACLILIHYLGLLLIAFELLVLGVLLLRTPAKTRAEDAGIQGRARPRLVLALTIAAVTVLSLFLLAYALITLPRVTSRAGFRFLPLPDLLRDLLNSFSLGLSVDVGDWYVFLIDLVFLLFLVLGFVRLAFFGSNEKAKGAGWLLAGYLVIPTALIYLMSYVQPAYMNSRHLILLTPAFYLLVATGLTSVQIPSLPRLARALSVLGWMVVVLGVSYSTFNYFHDPAYDKDHHRQWGAFLREHVRPGDVVVVDPPHISQLYQYYADSGVPWIGLPLLGKSPEETAAKLEELQASYDRIWLALSLTPPWGDRNRFPETWLNENAFRVNYKGFHSYASAVLAAAYLPGWPSIGQLPGDAQPLEVRYSPSLRLSGYRLVSPAQPGKALHVELFWSVDQQGPEEASMALRLVDSEGQVWAQGEQCAFNGLYPMWQWQPGLLLQDEHELLIQPGTPPGEYHLELTLLSRPAQEGCQGPRGGPIAPLSISTPEGGAATNPSGGVLLGRVTVDRPPSAASLDDLGVEQPRQQRYDGLVLLGTSQVPEELLPGQDLAVTLYWEAHSASLPDARFRLRAVGPGGEILAERVIRPAGDRFPTGMWQAGDRFKGQFTLSVPPEAPGGRYRLELVPDSIAQPTGLRGALSRWLGGDDAGLRLGSFGVQPAPTGQPLAAVTPVPVPAGLEISQPMLATLGDQVRFLGYDLESDRVRAGETLSFTLYWQAMRPLEISYSVFTHLLGPSNKVLGQQDGIPRGGTYPTVLWPPGEVVADSYRLTVDSNAPPGSHPLEVGLYQLETAQRLPVNDANGRPVPEDRILLPSIAVLPAASLQAGTASTPAAGALPRGAVPYRIYLPLVEGGSE